MMVLDEFKHTSIITRERERERGGGLSLFTKSKLKSVFQELIALLCLICLPGVS